MYKFKKTDAKRVREKEELLVGAMRAHSGEMADARYFPQLCLGARKFIRAVGPYETVVGVVERSEGMEAWFVVDRGVAYKMEASQVPGNYVWSWTKPEPDHEVRLTVDGEMFREDFKMNIVLRGISV